MADLLKVKDLKVSFPTSTGFVNAVDGVSFSLEPGESIGIVGESGSGKSVTALSLLGLVSSPGRVTGNVFFENKDLNSQSDRELRKVRGKKISMIFQEPMTSLNPVYTVGNQLKEVLKIHTNMSNQEIQKASVNALGDVGISDPESRLKAYPHSFSGGMRQRVMIAMALICKPEILIADEPTTALDVTIQAQILDLISNLREKTGMSVVMITHDLGVVHDHCDRVLMMYGGEIIERVSTADLFENCRHPYSVGLIKSIPSLNQKSEVLYSIEGQVPRLGNFPKYCKFQDRCEFAFEKCSAERPPSLNFEEGHSVLCHKPLESKGGQLG